MLSWGDALIEKDCKIVEAHDPDQGCPVETYGEGQPWSWTSVTRSRSSSCGCAEGTVLVLGVQVQEDQFEVGGNNAC